MTRRNRPTSLTRGAVTVDRTMLSFWARGPRPPAESAAATENRGEPQPLSGSLFHIYLLIWDAPSEGMISRHRNRGVRRRFDVSWSSRYCRWETTVKPKIRSRGS